MPSTPQPVTPKMGTLNPEKTIINGDMKNNFPEFLADFEKKGSNLKNLNLLNLKDIPIEKNQIRNLEKAPKNSITENMPRIEGIEGRDIEEIAKKFDPMNKLESNEVFLFQRELANKSGNKNDSIHSFSKVFNIEKKEKKSEMVENNETIGNFDNNNKKLDGILKQNQVAEEPLKFTSPKELFNWISKVISKSQIKSGETINLQIRDNTLGEFNISAQNATKGGEINMAIISQTKESDEFFKTNEKDLLKSLENAGVKIGKMEILTTENSKASTNSENMSDNKGSLSESIDNHFAQKDQLERDGQRRREIWNRYRDLRES